MTESTESTAGPDADARPPSSTVWPCLNYRDALAAIRMLVAFGFEERGTFTADDPDVIVHAELRWPEGGAVMLGSADRGESVFSQMPTGAASTYVVTAAVDDAFARAIAAGAEAIEPPTDQDYGGKAGSVRDLEGNIWSFGSYRGQ